MMETRIAWIAVALIFLTRTEYAVAIDFFNETFTGDGEFADVADEIHGFDNPDWNFSSQSNVFDSGTFIDGGFRLENDFIGDEDATKRLWRNVAGEGSFSDKVILRDVQLRSKVDGFPAVLDFGHGLSSDISQRISFVIVDRFDIFGQEMWNVGIMADGLIGFFEFPRSEELELGLMYDHELSEATLTYKGDDNPIIKFGPYSLTGEFDQTQFTEISIGYFGTGVANMTIDNWTLSNIDGSGVLGDFDGNRELNIADIDLLSAEVRAGTNRPEFELTGDNQVDEFDRNVWIKDLKETFFGDSNLDGEFNSRDLVDVFVAGEYEDMIELNSTWATGDWNGDGDFTSRDLVIAFADGGYEVGPREAVQLVPEPESATAILILISFIFMMRLRSPQIR